jgi:hypothetical protein
MRGRMYGTGIAGAAALLLAAGHVHADADAGCVAGGGEPVPFEALASGTTMIEPGQAPGIRVAKTVDEAHALALKLHDPAMEMQLDAAWYDEHVLVAVFAGPAASSGYGIEVAQVLPAGARVRLDVVLSTPDPERMHSDVISWPYAVIGLAREHVADARGWLVCDTEGRVVFAR